MCLSKRTCFRIAGGHQYPFIMRDRTVHVGILKAAFGFGYSGDRGLTRTALVRKRVRIEKGRSRKVVVLSPKRGTRLGGAAHELIIGRMSTGLSTM